MSKFFVDGNISDEEEDSNNQENQNLNRNQPSYQYDFMDDGRSNEKRVVRTEKEKKWMAIRNVTNKINNALNSQDFEKVWELLQELLRELDKSGKLIEKEGYPSFFLRTLKRVKDEIDQFSKNTEAKKKMKKHSSIAFNTMNQKLKKIYPDYEEHINELLEKGEQQEEHVSEESSESSSSSDDEDDITLLESNDPMVRRKYWLKKPKRKTTEDQEKVKDEEKKPEEKKITKQVKKEAKDVPQMTKRAPSEIQSLKDAENRMKQIRKNFVKLYSQEDREEFLQILDKINEKISQKKESEGAKDFEKLSFYLVDIPIRIDVCRQMKQTYFPRAQWRMLYSTMKKIYDLLQDSEEDNLVQNIILFEDNPGDVKGADEHVASNVTTESILLTLKTYMILIEQEIKKALVYLDSNEVEYFERLQDLISMIDLMYKLSKKLQMTDGYEKDAAQLAFKVLENCYFMDANLIERIKKALHVDCEFLELASEEAIQEYANLVLKYRPQEATKIKTLLYLSFNHTINDREKGKQLLIVSTLSEKITNQDYYTQVLYNRALVAVGLRAFRHGNMFQVQQFLYEMCSMAKMKENTKDVLKEFLAQGFIRHAADKDIPKHKILPAYLHLNTEIVEAVELIASMLLEIPYTLTEGGRITSKTFRKFTYEYERNFFIKEKLNRDLIWTASRALKEGEWKECYSQLEELSIWKHLPEAEETKENLLRIVKEQSLKCYLIGNRKCFKSIAISSLSTKYDLDEKAIRKHICKLISQKILKGSITREGYLVFVQKKQTEMQKVCEGFFGKLKEMTDASQLWLNQKISSGYDSDDEKEHIISKRSNLAINEKLKAILSKRSDKF